MTREAGDEAAALFNAQAAYADSIFKTALGDVEGSIQALEDSLSIKPDYAPAILSMGSVEFQLGKKAEALNRFRSLVSMPGETPDLEEIIDEAGDYLIQEGAYKEGLELFSEAAMRFPENPVFHQGIGCCAGHEGLMDEAIEASRRALELDPENQKLVNDLGWSLFQNGLLEEARETLKRAVTMDPSDDLARNNLSECEKELSGHP